MGILSGALSVRRYRVVGEVPDGFRETYQQALQRNAFRETADPTLSRERMGWVEIQNLLDHGFEDLNRWLYDRYLVFALRIDKKTLPSKLFKAHYQKRVQKWCQEHDRVRCPRPVGAEIRDELEQEMLARTLPRVQVLEICWNLGEGWLLFHSHTDSANEKFRKLFHQTFGLSIFPVAPLDIPAMASPDLAEALLHTGGLDYRPGGAL